MTVTVFNIYLSRPNKAYHAGEVMDGWVLLQVNSNENIRSIKLKFKGGEHTHITRSRSETDGNGNSRTVTDHYNESNILVDTTFCLYGDLSGNTRVALYAKKKYAFPFRITVPPYLVTSCYLSGDAYVKYVLHAEVDRPWAFDYNAYENPIIISPVDCNAPELIPTRRVEKDHEICCWPCSQGNVFFHTEIPFGGYFAGEKIPVQVEVHNRSSRQLPRATLTLVRKWRYSARGQVEYFNQTLDTQVFPLHAGQDQTNGFVFVPPNLDVTSFQGRLICLDYFLVTELFIEGTCIPNTREEIPIVIGSIPRKSVPPMMSKDPVNPVFAAPVAPPPEYEDDAKAEAGEVEDWPMHIPPPKYDEQVDNVKHTGDDLFSQGNPQQAQPANWV
eukprot:TRINITY_DN10056_c0_g2_i1.p1 TRINITY_DN10056_c0_g2~~TRINITY_DN10056_c0_g2_i1.p1  ORF type:complete len:387 (+),score=92.17 TRINITY_DN10056_c0_g2_i1:55-1215(+)